MYDNSAFQNAQSQLGQIQAKAYQDKPLDLYDQHRQAVIEWHAACKSFAEAQIRKAEAKNTLDKVSQMLADSIGQAIQEPQANPMPGNGGLNQFISR